MDIRTKVGCRFIGFFCMAVSTIHTGLAQGIPNPEPPEYEPQVLVSQLPGDAQVDNTGTASYNLSLMVPPGTSGMQPALGVTYSSRAGNGALGVGFSLSGISSISRMAPSREYEGFVGGVEFNNDDRLVLDGQRLLLVSTNSDLYGTDGTEYRTEIESFQRVVLHGDINSSNSWFEVRTKSGLVYQYGKSVDAFVEPPNRPEAITWAVNRVSDTAGNYMDFSYDEDSVDGEHLLERIDYTGNVNAGLTPFNAVEFIYTNRTDVSFRYHKGARYNTTKRLSRIEFYVDDSLTHEYRFNYAYGETGLSQLSSIQQFFANGDSIPATGFEWTDEDGAPGFVADSSFVPPVEIANTNGDDQGVRFMDLNGDGRIDLVYHNGSTGGAYLNSSSGWVDAPAYAPPFEFKDAGCKDRITFSDINGDGLPDMFYNHLNGSTTQSGAFINTGSGWASSSASEFVPPMHISFEGEEYTGVELVDFNTDGIPDLFYHHIRTAPQDDIVYLGSTTGWALSSDYTPPGIILPGDGGIDSGSRFLDIDGNRSVDELYACDSWYAFPRQANINAPWNISIGGAYNPPYKFIDDSDKSTGVQLTDVNGDGLADFLYHHKLANGSVTNGAYLNTGIGWATVSDTNFIPPIILKEDNAAGKGVRLIDVNGDGRVDIVRNNSTDADAWINTGTGWQQDNRYAPPYPILATDGKDKGTRFMDVNGDGLTDLIVNSGTTQNAWINQSRQPKLKKITTGMRDGGAYASSTELYYRPLTDSDVYTKGSGATYPSFDVQGPMMVVSEMAKENALGGKYWSMYTYAHGRSHRDRGFLGFQIFESYDPQTKISKIDYLGQDFPLTGTQIKSETRYVPDPDNAPDGQLLKEVENLWLYHLVWPDEYMSYYPSFYYVAKSTERKWELGNTNDVVSTATTYNWFDGQDTSTAIPNLVQYSSSFPIEIWYGDITKISVDYGDGTKLVTTSSYLADQTNWLLGRLNETTATHSRTGKPDIIRTSSFDYYNGTGFLYWEATDSATDEWTQTVYDYDSFGNITNKTLYGADIVARNEQSSLYDTQGRFVTESKNAIGHTETIQVDAVTGAVKSRTGPNNQPTSWQYDSLGRAGRETRIDGTFSTTTYGWEDDVTVSIPLAAGAGNTVFDAAYSITAQSSGSAPSKTYFDRQGRQIRSVTEAPDGRLVYQDTGYNAFGQTVAVSDPYFPGDTPNYGYSEFDELGRSKLLISPDGTKVAYGYAGLVSSITNNYGAVDGAAESRNQVTTTYKNAKGEVLKVVDNLGYEISYDYDAVGNLVKTTDELDNEVVMEYDLHGNKIRQDDPDMGEWFYDYNTIGQLTSQTNANGKATSMQYDLLGRMTHRTSPEGTAKWFYDNSGEGGKIGALWREEMWDSQTNLVTRKTHAYDSLKRPMLSLQNVDNKWYYTTVEYDAFSRVEKNHRFWRPQSVTNQLDHTWSQFTTVNHYNERGAITQVSDASGHVWWEIDPANVNAKGQLLAYTYGNGVETANTYDPLTGFITHSEAQSDGASGNDILSMQYTFDRLGNLTYRKNWRTFSNSETLTYDKLNRLRTSTVGSAVSGTTYNEIGNIQTKTGMAGTYQYDVGNAGPHAVTSANGVTYTYDNCGNMLGRWESGTNISSTAWTSFNKPSTMYNGFDGSEFTYNANHSRIVQIAFDDGDGTKKLYLDGFEQTEILTSNNQFDRANWQWSHQETRLFVGTPSGVVGVQVQTDTTAQRSYFHKDHLGSIIAVSGESGNLAAEFAFDAWGAARNPSDWTQSTTANHKTAMDRGFTGHEMLDNLNLVHMNGRIYDANLGRFLSADPVVQAPGDLQSYNRYSYVRNNPLTLTDPSGYSWWSDHVTDPISDAWDDVVDFVEEYWEVIVVTVVAVVATVLTAGLAAPLVGSFASGVWASVITGAIAGAAGGFAAGFSGTLLYGGSLSDAFQNGLTGALWGGVSGAIAGAIGYYANAYKNFEHIRLAKAMAHGARGGVVNLAKGDNLAAGFLSGLSGSYFEGSLIVASLAGGTASVLGGGKFENGAITAAIGVIVAGVAAGFSSRLLSAPRGPMGPGDKWDPFQGHGRWQFKNTTMGKITRLFGKVFSGDGTQGVDTSAEIVVGKGVGSGATKDVQGSDNKYYAVNKEGVSAGITANYYATIPSESGYVEQTSWNVLFIGTSVSHDYYTGEVIGFSFGFSAGLPFGASRTLYKEW